MRLIDAGWSSLVARRAHNPKVVGSNPAPATNLTTFSVFFLYLKSHILLALKSPPNQIDFTAYISLHSNH